MLWYNVRRKESSMSLIRKLFGRLFVGSFYLGSALAVCSFVIAWTDPTSMLAAILGSVGFVILSPWLFLLFRDIVESIWDD